MLHQTGGLYAKSFGKGRNGSNATTFSWSSNTALRMLGINYRWSNVVFDERGPPELDEETLKSHSYGGYDSTVGAGDRAPEVPNLRNLDTNEEVSLFDILKPTRHTVMIFVTDSTCTLVNEMVQVLESFPRESVYTIAVTSTDQPHSNISKACVSLFDSKDYARKHFNVGLDEFLTFAIRPDGYVGGICKSA